MDAASNNPGPQWPELPFAAWQDTFKLRDREKNWDVVDAVKAAAKEVNASPARVALAWALAQPGITSLIIGAKTVEQLDDNLGAEDLVLPPAVLKRLDEVSAVEWGYPFDFLTRVDGDWK